MAGAEVRTTRVRERRRRELHRVDDREAGHETAFSARQMKPYTGPPPTLGSTGAAGARIIMVPWVQPSRRARPRRDGCSVGADTTVPDWAGMLMCGKCGSRNVSLVVSGNRLGA